MTVPTYEKIRKLVAAVAPSPDDWAHVSTCATGRQLRYELLKRLIMRDDFLREIADVDPEWAPTKRSGCHCRLCYTLSMWLEDEEQRALNFEVTP